MPPKRVSLDSSLRREGKGTSANRGALTERNFEKGSRTHAKMCKGEGETEANVEGGNDVWTFGEKKNKQRRE